MGYINSTRQIWYADDSTACSSVEGLLQWWNALVDIGPQFGYYPNPSKLWLLVKTKHHDHAQQLFHGTDISITPEGRCVLGSPIGSLIRSNLGWMSLSFYQILLNLIPSCLLWTYLWCVKSLDISFQNLPKHQYTSSATRRHTSYYIYSHNLLSGPSQ